MGLKVELPPNYWDFIMKFLPDYTHRDDVLESDIFTRYLDGEDVIEEDIHFYNFRTRSRESIEQELYQLDTELFIEAYENFASLNDIPLDSYPYAKFILKDSFPILNASGDNTNFVYEVTGEMDDEKMAHFNGLFREVKRKGEICYDVATADRMSYLHQIGCDIRFVDTAKPLAKVNLIKSGGLEMPAIIGGMLKKFYYESLTGRTTMEDCVEYLAENDVVGYGFDDLEETYRAKIAHLLLCIFTGMRLGSKWNGRQEVNGGYIVVKNDDDVVAFHSAIAEEFKDFLVAKMIMERPSHSRHKDLVIYKEGDRYFLKLGLQLRLVLN